VRRRKFLRRIVSAVGSGIIYATFGDLAWASSPCATVASLPIPSGRSTCTYDFGPPAVVSGAQSSCAPCSPNCSGTVPPGQTCYCFEPACRFTIISDPCADDCLQAFCVACNSGSCSCTSYDCS